MNTIDLITLRVWHRRFVQISDQRPARWRLRLFWRTARRFPRNGDAVLTPIAHDLLVAYATTRDALLRLERDDALLQEFLRREYLDAQDDLYSFLWKFSGGRIETRRLVVAADSEGAVFLRPRGPASPARKAAPCAN